MFGVIDYQFRLNVVLVFKIEFLMYYYVWYTKQCFMLYKVILAVVDCGAPTQKLRNVSLLFHASWRGPNTVKLDPQFLQTMQVWEGPNTVKLDPQFLQTLQVGETGPTQKLVECQLTITCKLAGPQHSEIGFLISTDIASWGNGPQHRSFGMSACMNIIKKLGNKMLPNFIFKIINPI